MSDSYFTLKIFRGIPGSQYFESFRIRRQDGLNITSCLMEIQQNPKTIEGKIVEPVVWEQGCLEEVCGSCSMLINARPRQACSAIVEEILEKTKSLEITLAPFTKFPLLKDLIVDRKRMFENLEKVHAWIDNDGSHYLGEGPKISPQVQEIMYSFARCMTCGCCVEACPQTGVDKAFIGPQIIGQVRLFNLHPVGKYERKTRLKPLKEEGGISSCGNAQNCVKVCPKDIPLTDAIAEVGREVTLDTFREIFSPPETF